jgi:PHD-finger
VAPDDNLVVICDGCQCPQHQICGGISHIPEGDWYCDSCIALSVVVHYVQLLLLVAAAVLLLVLLVYDGVQASPLLVTVALLILVLNCHCY